MTTAHQPHQMKCRLAALQRAIANPYWRERFAGEPQLLRGMAQEARDLQRKLDQIDRAKE